MFVLCLLHILIYSIYLYCWTNKFTKLIGVAKEILNKRAFLSLFKLWSQNRVVTYLWQILKIFNLISNMQQTRSPYLFYFEDMNFWKLLNMPLILKIHKNEASRKLLVHFFVKFLYWVIFGSSLCTFLVQLYQNLNLALIFYHFSKIHIFKIK